MLLTYHFIQLIRPKLTIFKSSTRPSLQRYILLRDGEQSAQRAIDGFVVGKRGGNVRRQNNDVAICGLLCVFAAHAIAEVVFRQHFFGCVFVAVHLNVLHIEYSI